MSLLLVVRPPTSVIRDRLVDPQSGVARVSTTMLLRNKSGVTVLLGN